MNNLSIYIIFVFIIKIIFILLALTYRYLVFKKQQNTPLAQQIFFWKSRIDFVFTFLMSLLLIYVFYPKNEYPTIVVGEMRLLLFLFGIILIITADWNLFFAQSPLLSNIQNSLGTNNYTTSSKTSSCSCSSSGSGSGSGSGSPLNIEFGSMSGSGFNFDSS